MEFPQATSANLMRVKFNLPQLDQYTSDQVEWVPSGISVFTNQTARNVFP